MRKTFVCFFSFLLSFQSFSLTELSDLIWSLTYDGGGDDQSLLLSHKGLGSLYEVGTTQTASGLKLISRVFKKKGTVVRTRLSQETLSGSVLFAVQDTYLNVFLIVKSNDGLLLEKLSFSGIKEWSVALKDKPLGIKVVRGKVYLGRQGSGDGFFFKTYKSSDGSLLWESSDRDLKNVKSFTVDKYGRAYAGGGCYSSVDKLRLVSFEGSDGSLVWATNYTGPQGGYSSADLLTVDEKSNVYVAGKIDGWGGLNSNISVAKFNHKGSHQWTRLIRRENSAVRVRRSDLFLDLKGNPCLVLSVRDFYNVNPKKETERMLVTKVDAKSGEILWRSHPNDPSYSDQKIEESYVASVFDQEGDLYLLAKGNQENFVAMNFWILTKASGDNGSQAWIKNLGSVSSLNIKGLTVMNNKDIYLSLTQKKLTKDLVIRKYSQ